MGESILAPPMVEDKMKGSLNNNGSALEVSVSFGRFDSDSLSWEKWSSFSPNKYLEEVEKCATPGSVAQKKAYFEAHYKKIAARKIEEMEQEKRKEADFSNKDDHNGEDHVEKPCKYDDPAKSFNVFHNSSNSDESNESSIIANFPSREDQNSEDRVQKLDGYADQAKDLDDTQHSNNSDESNESSTITIDSQCSVIDEIVDSRSSMIDETNEGLSKIEATVLVQEETQGNGNQEKIELPPVIIEECAHSHSSQDKVESLKKLDTKTGKSSEKGPEKLVLGVPKKSSKMACSAKEKSLTATKKKFAPRLPKKIPEVSTPKASKPISSSSVATPRSSSHYLSKTSKPISISSTAIPSRSSPKKTTGSSLPRSKNVAESKKIAPSSLHMSLSLGPAPANNDSPSLPPYRRSLIMEKMGDKDIVKKAFKSFQKSFNQGRASGNQSSSGHNEVSTSRADRKVPGTLRLQSEYDGMRSGVGKLDAERPQLGRSLNSTITWPLKGVGMDQRHAKPAPSSSGIRSDGQRRDEKEAEIKKLRQNLNFKATPMPTFYRGHSASKSTSNKVGKHH